MLSHDFLGNDVSYERVHTSLRLKQYIPKISSTYRARLLVFYNSSLLRLVKSQRHVLLLVDDGLGVSGL